MKKLLILGAVVALSITTQVNATSAPSVTAAVNECPTALKFVKRKLNSQETVNLCDEYNGKAVLVVNTASYCGFTKQFTALEALYQDYKDKGLVVIGFPSHDFFQEDDDEGKTAELCEKTYGVKFPMFETTPVRGSDADPLFRILANKSGTTPKWNFYKYLISADGKTIQSFSSRVKPTDDKLLSAIKESLPSS